MNTWADRSGRVRLQPSLSDVREHVHASPASTFTQWEYVYEGRNDGRRADLYIRVLDETATTVRFFVELFDRDRDVYFKGEP